MRRAAAVLSLLAACAPTSGDGAGDDGDDDGTGGFIDAGRKLDGGEFDPGEECAQLLATVRDFSDTHPDFETFDGDFAYPGLVASELAADRTPAYAPAGPTSVTTGAAEFAQWYHDTPGVNLAVPVTITLSQISPGVFGFSSTEFFPVDGQGLGNEGRAHNFHFTTEIHTRFTYHGGEVFSFNGDDDLWMFVNGRLAIDLGGLHPPLEATVDLDQRAAELGITPGNEYAMEIFHAERHTTWSNFHVETTIACFQIP